jgi:cell division protein FtsL
MKRINLVLFAVLLACALALVTSQHHARKLFVELQAQQEIARQLETDFGKLQLEQSTWATHSRIERVAARQLQMRVPPPARVRIVPPPPALSSP